MNIWIAASDNNRAKVEEFLAAGQTPNDKDENGYTCMHAAASWGHKDLLKFLAEKGGDINVRDDDGDTPLHVVETADMARFLVEEMGADFKLKNSEDQTALEKLEEEEEDPELLDYLRALAGISVDMKLQESGINTDELSLPEGSNLRVGYENMPEENAEQRARIEAIMNSENPEEGLREYLQEMVRSQASNGEGSSNSAETPEKKKTRQD
ncbi:hypothetical protein TRVA0_052S00804 [Trichomonascus vanleenenianus]|uniref:uncharacterized protein n=1 Tax=Trichomonascus vanleenenianus TaxID=2268995 RepID=UPI003EC9E86B